MKKNRPTKTPRKPRSAGRRRPSLRLRRTPLQARAQETFERILNVTGVLLDQVGTDSISTNLIAKAADVNVATLYQYFPNKRAILAQLFQRQMEQQAALVENTFGAHVDRKGGWREAVDAAIDAVSDLRRKLPGVLPLRQAMRSDPELLAFDRDETRNVAHWLADVLTQRGSASPAQARIVARCCAEAVGALLDLWLLDSQNRDEQIIQQTKEMVRGYLAPYLDARRKGRARARRR